MTRAVRLSQKVAPDRTRLGDNADLHHLVIRCERHLVARGRRTMDLPAA